MELLSSTPWLLAPSSEEDLIITSVVNEKARDVPGGAVHPLTTVAVPDIPTRAPPPSRTKLPEVIRAVKLHAAGKAGQFVTSTDAEVALFAVHTVGHQESSKRKRLVDTAFTTWKSGAVAD